jgi:hypothetical protein
MKNWMGVVFVLVAFVIFSCSNDEPATSYMEVRLTDAPGDYEEVNIDVQGVEVNAGSSQDGWTSLNVKKGVYNILKLTNGIDTLLCNCGLPAGRISQIRLILGDNNSVKIDGQVIPLSTPSAQQSGLKLNVNAELKEGITYKMLLDFDAARSIVKAGTSGKYNLKPVIRTIAEAETGAVKGVVAPLLSTPAVYAIAGSDTVGTAFADAVTGRFLIKGLAAGSYKITFEPATGFSAVVKENVTVSIGAVTDLGIITF